MDRDTIIRLAREAGLEILSLDGEDEVGCGDNYHIQTDLIERFAALVAAYEREECAKVCEEFCDDPYAALTAERIRRRHQEQDMTDKPSGSFVLWENTLCNPLSDPRSMAHSAWHDGHASGVKAERKRIVDMLLDMHAKEERHNYYGFIANIIKEST